MACKNEKTIRPLRLPALKMLDDSELNAVAGGSKYLTYTFKNVVVSSVSWQGNDPT